MKHKIISLDKSNRKGSALILAVVLTSLLAIMGALFMMTARVDNISTLDVTANRELNYATQSLVDIISQKLIQDVPGVDPNNEYYDYPGVKDKWLASTEPIFDGTEYRWIQISDVTEYLYDLNIASQGVRVSPGARQFIPEYPDIELNEYGYLDESISDDGVANDQFRGQLADADGDGLADSKWIEIDNITSGKGKKIYAAIRVIDNGGMLNVNTAGHLDPYGPNKKSSTVDGHTQSHINLVALAQRDNNQYYKNAFAKNLLDDIRGSRSSNYEGNVFWRYNENYGSLTPFDISDELELRNRFLINNAPITTRLEQWGGEFFDTEPEPFTGNLDHWFDTAHDAGQLNSDYSYRQLATVYNTDRVIDPYGQKLVNIKDRFDAQSLYSKIMLDGDCVGPGFNEAQLAQVIANIRDYGDAENPPRVTTVYDSLGQPHYGDEAPHLYLSEIVCKGVEKRGQREPGGPPPPLVMHYSYAIEVFKPFAAPGKEKFNDWQIVITDPNGFEAYTVPDDRLLSDWHFTKTGGRLFVHVFNDPNADLLDDVKFTDSPGDGAINVDPASVLSNSTIEIQDPNSGEFFPATHYRVYFGTDQKAVSDANLTDDYGSLVNQGPNIHSFDPSHITKAPPYQSRTYYWRVDGFYDVNSTPADLTDDLDDIGGVQKYTTHADVNGPDPNSQEISRDDVVFQPGTVIRLERSIGGSYITVDQVELTPEIITHLKATSGTHTRSFERDVHQWARIKRQWRQRPGDGASLGRTNGWDSDIKPKIQTLRHRFRNVGEIGNVFKKSTYYLPDRILLDDTEPDIRLDLTDPNVQNIFRYITVMDPNNHINDPNETRVKGRVNINTAPWYVIAQLPWVSVKNPGSVARAITAYREKALIGDADYFDRLGDYGFRTIGQLRSVIRGSNESQRIDSYGLDGEDQQGYPDLTFTRTRRDGVTDDFEEQNLIFSRISDLVTVRSDVFTAYILVRIGTDGPQQRSIAILDRSQVKNLGDPVKIIALYKVPDPR